MPDITQFKSWNKWVMFQKYLLNRKISPKEAKSKYKGITADCYHSWKKIIIMFFIYNMCLIHFALKFSFRLLKCFHMVYLHFL